MGASYLALDYGTTALKAVLYDENLKPLGKASREWTYLYPEAGWIEHPAELYWEKTLSAINELFDRCGGRDSLEAVSVTGQAETLVCIDRDGRELGNAIVWLDTRPKAEFERFSTEIPAKDFYRITGEPGFDPIMPVLKLSWMKRNQPERYESTACFLHIKEYIIYKISGKRVCENSALSCSGYFDINKNAYDSGLLAFAGIDAAKLPEPMDSQCIVGCISPDARRATGMHANVQVVNGMLDQCASSIGAGAVDSSRITETTGTVLAISAALEEFDGSADGLLVLRHGLKGRFLALPNCSTAGVLLKWFRDQFLPEGVDYDQINRAIMERGRKESGLILLPHFAGYLSPVNNPLACGCLYGLSMDTTKWDVAHAIMEGVGFLLRENLELLERHGIRAESIVSLGGGAKSPLWLGVKANICNKEMCTLDEDESTALGCAINAALSLGRITEADIPGFVNIQKRYPADSEGAAIYQRKYENYLALNARLGFNPASSVTSVL